MKRWLGKLQWPLLAGLAAILLVGAYFRLAGLAAEAMRADTINCWMALQRGFSPFDWQQIFEVMGKAPMPFTFAFTKGFMDLFGLKQTFVTIRLPAVFMGLVSIAAAYGAGRQYGGVRTGVTAAVLLAVNPFHIQCSRECYYYVFSIAGGFGCVWAVLWMLDYVRNRARLTVGFYLLLAPSFFLLTHSHINPWALALLMGLMLWGAALYRAVRKPRNAYPIVFTSVVLVAVGLPLLFVPWGLPLVLSGNIQQHQSMLFREHNPLIPLEAMRLFTATAWGTSPLRAVATGGAIVLALVAAARAWKEKRTWTMLLLLGVGFFATALSCRYSAVRMNARYAAPLIAPYLILLAHGLAHGADGALGRLSGAGRGGRLAVYAPAALAVLLQFYPAHLATRMTGEATPYLEVASFADNHLPAGAPVLVDRWQEPWNELRVHPSTNVFFTYTIPNEPVETFLQYNWRETAKRFLTRFPDAAYLEISKQYWSEPRVGPWNWPREFFAHHTGFTNDALIALTDMGLSYRGSTTKALKKGYYRWLIVDMFYNLPEDVIARARSEGKRTVLLFGRGWGYVKTRDYADWRVLNEQAELTVHNLTDEPVSAKFAVSGVAAGKAKRVLASQGGGFTAGAAKVGRYESAPVSFPPGDTTIALRDPDWQPGGIPLFVAEVAVVELP